MGMKVLTLKILNSLLVGMILVAPVISVFVTTPVNATVSWYDTDWTYRRTITIDHTKIDAALTNYPIGIVLEDGVNFTASHALATGNDIRFTSDDGTTLLKYEREYHTNAGGGKSYYWVKVPAVSNTVDTTIYVYYGNAAASDGADPTNVWDANYKIVWHMHDLTTSAVDDSTTSSINGIKHAANEPIQTTATSIFYGAQDFTTAQWFIANAYDVGNVFTIQMWARPVAGYDANPTLWSGVHTDTYGGILFDQNLFWNTATGKLGWSSETGNSYVYTTTNMADNTWSFVAASANNKVNKIYHNADAPVSYTAANNPTSGITSHYNGTRGDKQQYFHGQMDEFRWSNIVRSDAWMKADYYNHSNALVSYSAESTGVSATVSAVAASNVLSSVARINGYLDNQGDAECTIVFGWSTASHAADFSAYTSNTTLAGTWATGESFYYDLSSLTPSTTYYFNVYANNGVGSDTGTELSFTTSAAATGTGVGAPTFFTGTPTDDSISLTWVRGASTNTTMIRYAAGNSAPTSNTTGTLLYNGGLTYTTLSGLDSGRTYSFIAWGISPEGAWSTSNVTLTITTLGAATSSQSAPPSTQPDNFFTDTDYTKMQNTLFYEIINNTIDNMGFTRNMGWFLLALLIAVIAGVLATMLTHKLAIGLILSLLLMGVGWLQGLVPLWIPMVSMLVTFALVGHSMRNQGG
jgi:hypothetical protein